MATKGTLNEIILYEPGQDAEVKKQAPPASDGEGCECLSNVEIVRRNIAIAREMKAAGYPASEIADLTGMTLLEIECLN